MAGAKSTLCLLVSGSLGLMGPELVEEEKGTAEEGELVASVELPLLDQPWVENPLISPNTNGAFASAG